MTIIVAHSVKKSIALASTQIDILKGIDLQINSAESLSIMGTSGSGKTTLLSLLAGLDTPSSGEIYLLEKKLNNLSEDQRAQLRLGQVGFVFQDFDLLPQFTAMENVMLPLQLNQDKEVLSKASHWLDKVGLKQRMDHYPQQLSGGEQQRVAIARAFVTQPKVLFADEPTGNLDTRTGEKIIELLFELNQQSQTALIIVTHDEALAKRCQKVYVLQDGVLIEKSKQE